MTLSYTIIGEVIRLNIHKLESAKKIKVTILRYILIVMAWYAWQMKYQKKSKHKQYWDHKLRVYVQLPVTMAGEWLRVACIDLETETKLLGLCIVEVFLSILWIFKFRFFNILIIMCNTNRLPRHHQRLQRKISLRIKIFI